MTEHVSPELLKAVKLIEAFTRYANTLERAKREYEEEQAGIKGEFVPESCQLARMAHAEGWPRSCPTCGLGRGGCRYGYEQVRRKEYPYGFYIAQHGVPVGRDFPDPA